jgi:hypothetical protein
MHEQTKYRLMSRLMLVFSHTSSGWCWDWGGQTLPSCDSVMVMFSYNTFNIIEVWATTTDWIFNVFPQPILYILLSPLMLASTPSQNLNLQSTGSQLAFCLHTHPQPTRPPPSTITKTIIQSWKCWKPCFDDLSVFLKYLFWIVRLTLVFLITGGSRKIRIFWLWKRQQAVAPNWKALKSTRKRWRFETRCDKRNAEHRGARCTWAA